MAATAINLQRTCRLTQVSIGQHQSTEELSRPLPSLVPGSAAALCPATTDTSGCLPRFHCPDACGASPTQRMLREGPMVEDCLTASATGLLRDLRKRASAKSSYTLPDPTRIAEVPWQNQVRITLRCSSWIPPPKRAIPRHSYASREAGVRHVPPAAFARHAARKHTNTESHPRTPIPGPPSPSFP